LIVESILRELAPQVVAMLARRYGQFDIAEDAVQEALLAAVQQWPTDGVPANPRGWLLTVASRRMINAMQADSARRRREDTLAASAVAEDLVAPAADAWLPAEDDTLTMLFLCCHPALTPASQIALTLRVLGGLTTAQIARAFLVPEATMAQRISRAK
jgi:RNA polymerase sigma factor (sigma-70 family)